MSNLLDKASIILTPTAYNNGEALCVKPSDGSGDFDFSRNSAATRVNAQGLVENVQILSSNLVQNGDFSEEGSEEVSNGSFSQEGVEQISNGDFSSDSDWVKGTGWSISGGKGVATNTTINSIYQDVLTLSKSYKASFTISSIESGSLKIGIGINFSQEFTEVGTYTYYGTPSNDGFLRITPSNGTNATIDNVSVREVGQNWALGTGWSIAEDKAVANTTGDFVNLYQNSVFVVGKTYKTTFTIVDYTQGKVRLTESGYDVSGYQNAVGTYTTYFTATQTDLYMQGSESFIGSVTNISVKEVLQDWSVEDYGAVSASAVITPYTEGVKLEKTVSADWRSSFLVQPISYTSGSQYKVTFKLKNGNLPSGGSVYVRATYDSSIQNIATTLSLTNDWVEYIYYFVADSNSLDISFGNVNWQNAGVGEYFYIDDVSVIEITDDTSLPRINYEGFSYQDALGSEEIVNGTFSSDTAWVKGSNWTISNNKAISDGLIDTYLSQAITGLDLSKTYKVEVTCTDYTSGNLLPKLGSSGFETFITSEGSFTYYGSFGTDATIRFYSSSFIGSITNISVKEYLGQEVVPDSGCGSWLFEPQSTNLVTYSEDFSQWSVGGTAPTLTSGQLSPSGEYNATKISGTIGSSILFTVGTSSETATRSVYAKSVSGTGTARLMSFNGNTNNLFTLTEEWQRFELTGAVPTGGNNFYFDFRDGLQTLSEYIIWGAQSEELTYATSYIPTFGSTVTRNQDLCDSLNIPSLLGQTEGAFFIEVNKSVAGAEIFSFNRSTNNSFQVFTDTINYKVLSYYEGGYYNRDTSIPFTDTIKIAVSYKNNELKLYANGTEFFNSNVFTWTPNDALANLFFNKGGYVAGNKSSEIKALAVWKEALSDSELQSLTTI
tara:strand:+ start:595 stop:3264 length:2670 start_codon:yes stop_codon:yes gene_type:complete